MGRRDFLRLLGATAAVAASAPALEQLLWTPSTSIVVPSLPYIEVTMSSADLAVDSAWMQRHIEAAARALADRIDADIAAMYQRDRLFFAGDTWRTDGLRKA